MKEPKQTEKVVEVIHKKVGPDFLGETFHVLKEKEEK
jgi:hypothetical protein